MNAIKLGEQFDTALMGATIRGQFAYSLTRLAEITMEVKQISIEDARKIIFEDVVGLTRNYGDEAPVFIDDALTEAVEEPEQEQAAEEPEQNVIAMLGQNPIPQGENVILIPGQNHGAVKGFLDPDGLAN
jgi:hypothetical protein